MESGFPGFCGFHKVLVYIHQNISNSYKYSLPLTTMIIWTDSEDLLKVITFKRSRLSTKICADIYCSLNFCKLRQQQVSQSSAEILFWKLSNLYLPEKRNLNSCMPSLYWLSNHPSFNVPVVWSPHFFSVSATFSKTHTEKVNKWVNFSSSFSLIFLSPTKQTSCWKSLFLWALLNSKDRTVGVTVFRAAHVFFQVFTN